MCLKHGIDWSVWTTCDDRWRYGRAFRESRGLLICSEKLLGVLVDLNCRSAAIRQQYLEPASGHQPTGPWKKLARSINAILLTCIIIS